MKGWILAHLVLLSGSPTYSIPKIWKIDPGRRLNGKRGSSLYRQYSSSLSSFLSCIMPMFRMMAKKTLHFFHSYWSPVPVKRAVRDGHGGELLVCVSIGGVYQVLQYGIPKEQ